MWDTTSFRPYMFLALSPFVLIQKYLHVAGVDLGLGLEDLASFNMTGSATVMQAETSAIGHHEHSFEYFGQTRMLGPTSLRAICSQNNALNQLEQTDEPETSPAELESALCGDANPRRLQRQSCCG